MLHFVIQNCPTKLCGLWHKMNHIFSAGGGGGGGGYSHKKVTGCLSYLLGVKMQFWYFLGCSVSVVAFMIPVRVEIR